MKLLISIASAPSVSNTYRLPLILILAYVSEIVGIEPRARSISIGQLMHLFT